MDVASYRRPVLVVTGAAGFIGRHVLEQAAAIGAEVIAVDRRQDADERIDLLVDLADATDRRPDLVGVLASATAVIHLAGAGGVRSDVPGIAGRRRRDNVLAARSVLALTPPRVPVIVTSSSSVYGGCQPPRRNHEHDRLRPRGGYATSKVAVEQACRRRAGCGGRVTVVRPFTVIGAGQRADMALSQWVAQALAGQPLTVFGAIDRTRDLTDARDAARSLIRLAALAPQVTVNLGSGTRVTLEAMTAAVRRTVADTGVQPAAATVEEPDHTLADVARCHGLLGFVPRSPDLDTVVGAIAAELRRARRPTSAAVA
jgi:nucleoside-diphosphate-sugar epimerase